MGFMKPKIQKDPALEAQKAAERAVKIDQAVQSTGDENLRLFQIFGKRSLLSGAGSAMPGAQATMFGLSGMGRGTL